MLGLGRREGGPGVKCPNRFSVLFMSCGAMCILARTLIWQQGPGAFDLSSLLTSAWQFEAAGKGSVAEPVMSFLPPSAALRAFLLMLEPALRRCWKQWLPWLKVR